MRSAIPYVTAFVICFLFSVFLDTGFAVSIALGVILGLAWAIGGYEHP